MQTLHRAVSHHRRDEAYMARMCHEGWAAARRVEGFWTFEPCRPDQYVCRVCYLRGKSGAEVEALRRARAAQGIEFVSRYSFWALFCALAYWLMSMNAANTALNSAFLFFIVASPLFCDIKTGF